MPRSVEHATARSLVEDWALDDRDRPPPDMLRELEMAGHAQNGIPTLRSVQRWAATVRGSDEPWTVDRDPDLKAAEFRLAGQLIRRLVVNTKVRRKWPTRDEVRKALWVHTRAPGIPISLLHAVVKLYLIFERTGRKDQLAALDYLVLHCVPPMEEGGGEVKWFRRWADASDAGILPQLGPEFIDTILEVLGLDPLEGMEKTDGN